MGASNCARASSPCQYSTFLPCLLHPAAAAHFFPYQELLGGKAPLLIRRAFRPVCSLISLAGLFDYGFCFDLYFLLNDDKMQCDLPIKRALYSKRCCCWHQENEGRKTSKPMSTGLGMWIIPISFFLSQFGFGGEGRGKNYKHSF